MRFVVRSVSGYSENARGSDSKFVTSYMVLDSHNNYREVRSFYAGQGKRSDYARRTLANEAAATLNEWDAAHGRE